MKNNTIPFVVGLISYALSHTVMADEVTNVVRASSSFKDSDSNNSLSYTHYVDPLVSQGPKDYFGFNKRNNHIGFDWHSNELEFFRQGSVGIDGEYNHDNWRLSGAISQFYHHEYSVDPFYFTQVDYFISDDWNIGIWASKSQQSGDFEFGGFNTNYQMQLSENNNLGFSLRASEDFDEISAGLEYFQAIENDQYLLFDIDFDEKMNFTGRGAYYFNRETSLSLSFDQDQVTSLAYSTFITSNLDLYVSINKRDDEWDTYFLAITGYY